MTTEAHNKCALCTGLAYMSLLTDSRSERGRVVNAFHKRASQLLLANNYSSARPDHSFRCGVVRVSHGTLAAGPTQGAHQ